MSKVKITVLKTTLDKELAREYGAEGLTACPLMKEGQIFYVDYAKPEGFCDGAWIAIHPYVFSLVHGTGNELFYYGLRPVIFKVESAGQDSAMEYEPVR